MTSPSFTLGALDVVIAVRHFADTEFYRLGFQRAEHLIKIVFAVNFVLEELCKNTEPYHRS
ncbi:MAG: hypothetical protein EBT93_08705 [Alphaproteobacteria bacterium]|nr:hypothetical protein [Alphaproteobacteria bacterium]